eukprot:8645993-Alexandrium_andersonii.AAC.1
MAWAAATLQCWQAQRPARAERDGPFRFQGEILMDDAVLVDPQLGLQPWVSMDTYEKGVRQLLGESAINSEKDALEGNFS